MIFIKFLILTLGFVSIFLSGFTFLPAIAEIMLRREMEQYLDSGYWGISFMMGMIIFGIMNGIFQESISMNFFDMKFVVEIFNCGVVTFLLIFIGVYSEIEKDDPF